MAQLTPQPTSTKIIIAVIIFLAIGANIGAFVVGRNIINHHSQALTSLATDLKKAQNELDKMEFIKHQQAKLQDIPEILKQLTVDLTDNKHQEKLIQVLNFYAAQVGLEIDQINFDHKPIGQKSSAKNIINLSLTISKPSDYQAFLKFMKLTETGLLRMQIERLSLTRSSTDKKGVFNAVTISNLEIKVYAK